LAAVHERASSRRIFFVAMNYSGCAVDDPDVNGWRFEDIRLDR